ncbi:hypothetical protein BDF22DRAFT_745656 [Syncephalis plumigaleata]|nr:hypothetical protein BDF22DRAFT_745656 [Syncephalis plumigaleata]
MPQTYTGDSSRPGVTTPNPRTRSQTAVQRISVDESTQSPLFPATYAPPLSPSLEVAGEMHDGYAASEAHRTPRPRSMTAGPQSNVRYHNPSTYSPRLHSERFRYVGAAAAATVVAAEVQAATNNTSNHYHESSMHTSKDYHSTTNHGHNQHTNYLHQYHPTPLDKRALSAESPINIVPNGRRPSGGNLKNPRVQITTNQGGGSYSPHSPTSLSPTSGMASSPRGDRRWRERRNSNGNNTRMSPTHDGHLYDMSITAALQHTSPSESDQSRGYFASNGQPQQQQQQQQQHHHAKTSSHQRQQQQHHHNHRHQQHHRQHQHRGSGPDHSAASAATTTTEGTGRIIGDSNVSRAPSLRAVAGGNGQGSGPGPGPGIGGESAINGNGSNSRPPSVPASRRTSIRTESLLLTSCPPLIM